VLLDETVTAYAQVFPFVERFRPTGSSGLLLQGQVMVRIRVALLVTPRVPRIVFEIEVEELRRRFDLESKMTMHPLSQLGAFHIVPKRKSYVAPQPFLPRYNLQHVLVIDLQHSGNLVVWFLAYRQTPPAH
jgi:hypothetical protein